MSVTSIALPAGALVFQCGGCKSILSDSQEFACTIKAPDGAKCVCVRGITDARVDRIANTAVDSSGVRSTHFAVCCACCGAAVGRLYSEAPEPLRPAVGLFCLEVSRCFSYELGCAETRAAGDAGLAAHPQQQQTLLATAGAAAAAGAGGAAAAGAAVDPSVVLDLMQRVEQLEALMCTMQGMQVLHDAQLRDLPGYQADAQLAAADGGS